MKDEFKKVARLFRECADIFDEVEGCEDEEKTEELCARLVIKLLKAQGMMQQMMQQ